MFHPCKLIFCDDKWTKIEQKTQSEKKRGKKQLYIYIAMIKETSKAQQVSSPAFATLALPIIHFFFHDHFFTTSLWLCVTIYVIRFYPPRVSGISIAPAVGQRCRYASRYIGGNSRSSVVLNRGILATIKHRYMVSGVAFFS